MILSIPIQESKIFSSFSSRTRSHSILYNGDYCYI